MVHSSDVQHTPIAELVPELDRLAADVMADWKVPGAAIAVVLDGKVARAKAYGQRNVEAELPVTAATQFVIGSITKSFTTTGVALLHNEGRVDWSKPVRDTITFATTSLVSSSSVSADKATGLSSAPG